MTEQTPIGVSPDVRQELDELRRRVEQLEGQATEAAAVREALLVMVGRLLADAAASASQTPDDAIDAAVGSLAVPNRVLISEPRGTAHRWMTTFAAAKARVQAAARSWLWKERGAAWWLGGRAIQRPAWPPLSALPPITRPELRDFGRVSEPRAALNIGAPEGPERARMAAAATRLLLLFLLDRLVADGALTGFAVSQIRNDCRYLAERMALGGEGATKRLVGEGLAAEVETLFDIIDLVQDDDLPNPR